MYLRKQKKANGRIYLSIVQSYRTAEGKPRSKTLWSLGYLDDLEREFADPIVHFQEMVKDLNSANEEKQRQGESEMITLSPHATISFGQGATVDAGAAIVASSLFRDLRLGHALERCNAPRVDKRLLKRSIELLAWNRIARLQPIAETWACRGCVSDMESLSLDALYDCIGILGAQANSIAEGVSGIMAEGSLVDKEGRAYCFVTNHYVEEFRYTTPEFVKNWRHRANPIVQLAVMTDSLGTPVDYAVFIGSLSTPLSSLPAIQEIVFRHPHTRFIVVSDKTVGAGGEELAQLAGEGHGFILLQSLRKGPRESRDWVVDAADYTPYGQDGSRFKERMGIRTVESSSGAIHGHSIAVKEVALWQRSAFEDSRCNRFRIVKRNEDVIANGVPSDGTVRPIRAVRGSGDAKPGEVGDHIWHVYWDKIAADEAMDGCKDIITSELGMPAGDVIALYYSLRRMCSFFMPIRGEWSACPERLARREYIQAHFLVCYLAACVTQMLARSAGDLADGEVICDTLARLVGYEVDSGRYFFNYRTKLSDKLAETAGVDLSRPLMSASAIARMMQKVRQEA